MKDPKKSLILIFAVGLACGFSTGCGGGSGSSSSTPANTITSTGANVASISVNGGPAGNYPDASFTTVTVCLPGTSTCQTIDGILVDTGSSGLRILSSVLTLSLPQQKASDGNPVVECLPFVSGYTWGPVQTADVEIASEKASSLPVQVLSDTEFIAPTSCTSTGTSSDTLESLGANGILGVGLFAQDCGSYCEQVQTAAGDFNPYYECASATATCQAIGESLTQQVQNPVVLFSTDNNGVIVEFPAVSGGEAPSVSGSLVFGIATQSNNALAGTVYAADSATGNFSTTYNGTAYTDASFIDSGSNGYFFPSTITQCGSTSNAPGFYCPSTIQNLSATNGGTNGTSGTVDFRIANALTLSGSDDFALSDLGGTFSDGFDWGLPFFFGRNVYIAIQGQSAPGGTAPYWAY
ncbi:MAG: DUF3443 domain-containing protein [Candidatus Sulfotelmatobacter sp.]